MRILLLFFFVFVIFVLPDLAQTRNQADDLRSMVETERAFARLSEEKGTREAFAEFIAADGILFRPTAVVGKKWMLEHPLPAYTTRPLLTWQPIFAAVSRAGDLGYTTGPWQFKNDIKDDKAGAFGNFMTVWKKQADGSWKFALDLGISNPEPRAPAATWQLPESAPSTNEKSKTVNQEKERSALLTLDREFSNASGMRGAAAALPHYAGIDVRLFREGKFPFVGKIAAVDALLPLKDEWTWTPAFADVAVSGDLGYSYGTYELREKTGTRAISEKGNYVRVWQKIKGYWKVVVDVANPLPPETRKN